MREFGGFPQETTLLYFDQPIDLHFNSPSNNVIQVGFVFLTKVGEELAKICETTPVEGFRDYLK